MFESTGPLANIDFFRGALPEAVFWGRLALGVGIAGAGASLVLMVVHLRDQLSLSRGYANPQGYRPLKLGPLNRCLGEFFADPLHAAPLSPDAASEFITGRLDVQHDLTHSVIRYFAYAPLLLGLMGTTFALRTLLVIRGNTLQEIQPQLGGVFAGTLAGIGGSLLASVGGLLLDRVALTTANRTQDFIHRFIIPTLPERRISIRVEDAVLTLITERAQSVAESFRQAMQPVATQLEEVAERCGKAAEAATNAFSEAARALREAGNLEAASRNFKAGAHMIDSSAEQLSDATKQTAEIVLRAGEVRGSLKSVLESIQAVSGNLGSASERVGGQLERQLTDLNTQLSRVDTCANSLASAVDRLSTELLRRAESDSVYIEAIKGYADATGRAISDLAQTGRESSEAVTSIRVAIDAMDGRAIEAIKREITPRFDEAALRTEHAVEKLDGVLVRHIGSMSTQLTAMKQRSNGSGGDGSTVGSLGDAVKEIRRASEEVHDLTNEVRRSWFRLPWR
jgi:methyl-accepting chemotaxis protein